MTDAEISLALRGSRHSKSNPWSFMHTHNQSVICGKLSGPSIWLCHTARYPSLPGVSYAEFSWAMNHGAARIIPHVIAKRTTFCRVIMRACCFSFSIRSRSVSGSPPPLPRDAAKRIILRALI
ncbi:hypothetical protein V1264_003890 [Littorina saxatilis]|uniref:Uncharacterized protein n=1 Tax=Littorina saxatilis TaxID=31220 RepID=A0AAN9G648_9CAEN